MYFDDDIPNDGYAEISFENHWGNKVSYQIQGKDFTHYKDKYWQLTINELAVPDVSQNVKVVIYAADGKTVYVTANDSMKDYIARKSSTNALYETIMKFGLSSHAYFHQPKNN
jgi:hypothetical protein